MSRSAEFIRELNKLYHRRTSWLRTVLDAPNPGPPPGFGRKHVSRAITKLQCLASETLSAYFARKEFERSVEGKRSWHIKKGKGYTYDEKKRTFKDWYARKITNSTCIYVLWKNHTCLYVGKTKTGAGRPASHFEKAWFRPATRIDIYVTRGKHAIPALECLAIHRFRPLQNKVKAAKRKYTQKCPLCLLNRDIERELRSIFRFK